MKILGICGSPRKGNTEFMMNTVLGEAEKNGSDTELVLLKDMDIKHCTACDTCFGTEEPCILQDDMTQLYGKLREADLIVLGSPNYFQNVSGMMKVFIDRTNALVNPPQLKSKKFAGLSVGGQDYANIKFCEDTLLRWAQDNHKMEVADTFLARAEGPEDPRIRAEAVVEELKKMGRKISK